MTRSGSNKVLYSVLNWGLGHATRSISVIEKLLELDFDIAIASDGDALEFMKKEFPSLTFYALPALTITYPYHLFHKIKLGKSIFRSVGRDHKIFTRIVEKYNPNLIISDHRLGCFSNDIPSILLLHQYNLMFPNVFLRKTATKIHHHLVHKFKGFIVPDDEAGNCLSGLLSRGLEKHNSFFCGPLSHLEKKPRKIKYDILFLLSGPEPNRTDLQNRIRLFLKDKFKGSPIAIVRGKGSGEKQEDQISWFGLTGRKTLSQLVNSAKYVICRSGYSSVMDLATIQKKALLIPTPDQPEQQYLARHLEHINFAPYLTENQLNWQAIDEKISSFNYKRYCSHSSLKDLGEFLRDFEIKPNHT